MNYISHYYFDRVPNDPYHNLGLLMPDFVRNFIRRRLKRIKPVEEGHKPSQSLAIGTLQHIERDRIFHHSAYFQKTEAVVIEALKPAFKELDMQRYWFAGHLLSEMMIDRVLMKQHPNLAVEFYLELNAVDFEEVARFLRGQGLEETDAFGKRLQRFLEVEYLKKYVDDDALTYSLNRIFMFTGAGVEWSSEQFNGIKAILPKVESIIFESMEVLIDEMT